MSFSKLTHQSGNGLLGGLVSTVILELAIVMVSDFIVRPFFRQDFQQGVPRRNKFNLLVTQELLLLASISVLLLLQHTPYIVMAAAAAVLFRAIQLKWRVPVEVSHFHTRPVVSKPIARAMSRPGLQWSHSESSSQGRPYSQPWQCTEQHSAPSLVTPNAHRVDTSRDTSQPYQSRHELIRQRLPISPAQPGSRDSTTSLQVSCSQSTMGSQASFSKMPSSSAGSSVWPDKQPARPHTSIEHVPPMNQATSAPIMRSTSSYDSFYSADRTTYDFCLAPSTAPPGLVNIGNTCFVNSTLQCLNWTPDFVQTLPQVIDTKRHPSTFMRKLKDVFKLCSVLPDGKSYFRPIPTTELLSSLSHLAPHLVAPANSAQHQQDTAEYLLWLLNHLHSVIQIQVGQKSKSDLEAMQGKKRECLLKINKIGSQDLLALMEPMTYLSQVDWDLHRHEQSSALYDLFLGQILEARECQKCKKVTVNIEYFTLLPLPVPLVGAGLSMPTLESCFQQFSEQEELVQDNMISCSCMPGEHLVPATRLALLSIIPKSLIIQLTRFSYNSTLQKAFKNDSPLCFPQRMNIFPHTMKARLDPTQEESTLYELHAFCVHSGAQSTSFGHYMAYCRASNGQWYMFNDTNVTHIEDIDNTLKSEFVLRNAYLLFYHSLTE